jgi:hypothetical protein
MAKPLPEPERRLPAGPSQFASTHWSVVLRASDSQTPQSGEALERLCRAYWYPLYVYVRSTGRGQEELRDSRPRR